MKKVWMRVGMAVNVTDKQWEKLKKQANGDDLDVPDWLLEKAKKKGEIDGDSYIPYTEFEEEW